MTLIITALSAYSQEVNCDCYSPSLYFQVFFAGVPSDPSKKDLSPPSLIPIFQPPQVTLEDVDVFMDAETIFSSPTDTNQTLEDGSKTEAVEQSVRRDNEETTSSNRNLDGHCISSNESPNVQKETAVEKGKLGGFPWMKACLTHADIHNARNSRCSHYNKLLRQLRGSYLNSDENLEYFDDIPPEINTCTLYFGRVSAKS